MKIVWEKSRPGPGTQIMRSPGVAALVQAEVDRVMAAVGEGYESDVSDVGRDRVRGAVWTVSPRAMRRTARDGDLLNALTGGV